MIYQYKKKESPRKDRISDVIHRICSDFIYESIELPVTVSRVVLSPDLSCAKIFIVMPLNSNNILESILRIVPYDIAEKFKTIDCNEKVILALMCYNRKRLYSYIAKKAYLKKLPLISFFIEKEDDYIKNINKIKAANFIA